MFADTFHQQACSSYTSKTLNQSNMNTTNIEPTKHTYICNQHKHNQNTTLKTPNLSDCISCHMPLENSKTMKLELEKENLQPVKVRSHLIGINPNLTSE